MKIQPQRLLFSSLMVNLLLTFATSVEARRLSSAVERTKTNVSLSCFCDSGFEKHLLKQRIDHFNYKPESDETFQQKYFVYKKYWGGGDDGDPRNSPIFVYLGGAEALDTFDPLEVGFMLNYASHFKALLVYIEHRFYGTSVPMCGTIEEIMRNADKRAYFNSVQALADYAETILHIKRIFHATDCPVVVIGKGYGGMLAAWFRLQYPHIAYAALASSAPILGFDNIISQSAFHSKVTVTFKEVSESCYKTIRQSWDFIDEIAYQPQGIDLLSKTFRTCKPLTSAKELKKYMEDIYVDACQQYSPTGSPVHVICAAIDDPHDDCPMPINKIANGLFAYLKYTHTSMAECTVNAPVAFDGWGWQTCSEMVMPISPGNDPDSMFQPCGPFNYEEFSQTCVSKYGISPRPHWITTHYGGHNIDFVLKKFGSHIIFSNGLKDPHSAAGVLYSISDTIVSVVTEYGSYGMDLQIEKDGDPDWLIYQRKTEVKIIDEWLRNYYCDFPPRVYIAADQKTNGDLNFTRSSLIQSV